MTQTPPHAPSYRFWYILAVLIMPVALALTGVRLVLNPWFVEFEYRTPNFPEDPYGFSMQERLQYAHIALDYLLNDAGIEFLGDLRFPAGQQVPSESCQFVEDCTRMYNDRELRHMYDVKNAVLGVRWVWVIAWAALLVVNLVAYRAGWEPDFRRALGQGAQLTLILIGVILVFVFFLFDWFFVFFHQIFFEGTTWLFYRSDTLIRLFPERFWSDTFIMVGSLTALLALLIAYGPKIYSRLLRR